MNRASREAIRLGIVGYVDALNALGVEEHKECPLIDPTKFHASFGTKYAKVIRVSHGGGTSVHSFVNRANGDILKAASHRAPAKHPRGSVLDRDFGIKAAGASVYGVRYLS